jgi:hypothetical protein
VGSSSSPQWLSPIEAHGEVEDARQFGGGRGTSMAATPRSTRRPSGHSAEHVSRVAVPDLETVFGPARVRIWVWANYESCSFPDALQLLFKDPSY